MPMQIGRYEVTSFVAGHFRLDGGAMFGSVPKVLWEREQPPDEQNRIRLAARLLLLRGDGRVIVVDSGCGDKFSEKELGIYGIESEPSLMAGLTANGVKPEDVTDVVLTHLHFDHGGGCTRLDESGKPVMTFPNARHHVQRANLETATNPNIRERASYLADNIEPIREAGKFVTIDGNEEILPGLRATVSNGHTAGLQVVEVLAEGGVGSPLFFPADLMPTHSHLRVPWTMGYDLHAQWIMDEKAPVLDRCLAENGIIVFEHDPEVGAVRLQMGKRYHEVAERVVL